jgi:hypothetical protein
MANDRHYRPGDNYLLDDISGFKIRASRAQIIPGGITGGLAVSPLRWEQQQPQDFVKGVDDDQSVDLARSRQTDQFVVIGSVVTTYSPVGSTTIDLASTAQMQALDVLQIMLDQGENFLAKIASIAGRTVTLDRPLTGSVGGRLGSPLENQVIDIGPQFLPLPS